MNHSIVPPQVLAAEILRKPWNYRWSFQGFGFYRTYLTEDRVWRLHVWDTDLRKPGVTTIHNHPWGLISWVIAGKLLNQRYRVTGRDDVGLPYREVMIRPGDQAHLLSEYRDVSLHPYTKEAYWSGAHYRQRWDEVHETNAKRGTVTLVKRIFGSHLPDEAKVYCPGDSEWVDAAPYDVEYDEAEDTFRLALENFHALQ